MTLTGLREDLDVTIECVRDMLEIEASPSMRECLWAEVGLGHAILLYPADSETLRRLLRRLRSLQRDFPKRLSFLAAASLARTVVELDPVAVSFPVAGA